MRDTFLSSIASPASLPGGGQNQITETSPEVLLRQIMRGVASTVVIVTTGSLEGERHAMTATSFTSVSLKPPTILVCINQQASVYKPIHRFGRFCINVLRAEHEGLARACSNTDAADRFLHHAWLFDETGLPYLENAQAVLFCDVLQELPTDTHAIVVGKVLEGMHVLPAAPLIYLAGDFMSAVKD